MAHGNRNSPRYKCSLRTQCRTIRPSGRELFREAGVEGAGGVFVRGSDMQQVPRDGQSRLQSLCWNAEDWRAPKLDRRPQVMERETYDKPSREDRHVINIQELFNF